MYDVSQEVNILESVENEANVGKGVARQSQTWCVDDKTTHPSDCQGEDAYADELETVIGELR